MQLLGKSTTDNTTRWFIVGVVVGIAAVVWPQTPKRLETPELVLDRGAMQYVEKNDAALAKSLPAFPAVESLKRLYLDQGLAENHPTQTEKDIQKRSAARLAVLKTIPPQDRIKILVGLRAWAVMKLNAVLDKNEALQAHRDLIGSFELMLRRYHLISNGVVVAPHFVVRTLYKARWNAVHRLPLTQDFSKIENQAYYGWLALYADEAPIARRLEALQNYARAEGAYANEAKGVLLVQAGLGKHAGEALNQALKVRPRIWLRNYLRASQVEKTELN